MKRTLLQIVLASTVLLTLLVGRAVSADTQYTPTDLGTLGGTLSNARAINDHAQIVGGSDTAAGEFHAFLWANGAIIDLGTLGGKASSAAAINNQGQITGMSQIPSGRFHAFLWENGIMIDLGTLGGSSSYANSINDTGQIVGQSSTTSGKTHAFLWEHGVMIDLGTLGGSYSQANAINSHGQVVGTSDTATGEAHAFLWENGVITDLGTLPGGLVSGADDINDHQQVVGSSETSSGETHAVLWSKGSIIDLGVLRDGNNFSQAIAINDQSQIAGSSGDMANWEADQAFLWKDGTLINLGTLGGNFATAFDINSTGQIVGFSSTATGEQHAVLWSVHQTNVKPAANAGGPYAAFSGETVTLDASGSSDPDGDILTYQWDLDNDGQYDDAVSVTVEITFQKIGKHLIGLQVTDTGGLYDTDIVEVTVIPVPIKIDIKPGSFFNPINIGSQGVVPVAVLTTAEFNASALDPATVAFAAALPLRWSWQDVDWDGDIDLLLYFSTSTLRLDVNSTEAALTGKTVAGLFVEGQDLVKIVPTR